MAGISRTLGGPALALVALCVSLVLIHAASSSDALPRGADPAAAAAYVAARSSGTFACLDGSRQVPLHAINDDFCDCVNGSDEPGGDPLVASTVHPL
jgi:protein kinase C substrate 80K-H